ncbi:MAG: hypothetical protein Fur0017_25210 [Anaerolineales bacterium]
MAPKANANKWSDIQLAIAAISMTSVIAFWNIFAGPDKAKADDKAAAQQTLLIPTVTPTVIVEPPAPEVTMPPIGYTILFGGKAPQPQVIVVQKPKGGGGGGGNEDSGGGGGAPASQPSTSTSSS